MKHKLPRREFCALTGIAITSVAIETACSGVSGLGFPNDGRLSARPRTDVKTSVTGEVKLGVNSERDAVLQIPKSAGQSPLPLLVMLHGTTWDAIRNTFADDVNDLNRALERTFEKVAIDPARVALGGFSDGATYAISLGLINGGLFSSVLAFSPGFVISGEEHGKPRFFLSHGTHDHILPIDRCGRRIAAELKGRGFEVSFRE